MRLASLLFRHRRQLLMQLDALNGSATSLSSRISPSLKRPSSQSATQSKTDSSRGSKHARLASTSEKQMASSSSRQNTAPDGPSRRSRSGRARSSRHGGRGRGGQSAKKTQSNEPALPEPLLDQDYLYEKHGHLTNSGSDLGPDWQVNPKSALSNFMISKFGRAPVYDAATGQIRGKKITRISVVVLDDIVGVGDAENRKDAERMAAFAANCEILLAGKARFVTAAAPKAETSSTENMLSDGSKIGYEKARQFMDYYCRKFGFGQPFVDLFEQRKGRTQSWEAVMTVGGRRIGIGSGKNKKDASRNCYLDVVQYLEKCDKQLWDAFLKDAKSGKDLGLAPKVHFQISDNLDDDIRDLCTRMKQSTLYSNRPDLKQTLAANGDPGPASSGGRSAWRPSQSMLSTKSSELSARRKAYLSDSRHEKMRQTRSALPVYTKSEAVLKQIEENEVSIVMAATGSGKTTQIPQLILDDFIDKGKGAHCNIFCTQPRRLAAISIAQRVAKERGENAGKGSSIGYQVRFEAALPNEHGSVTFCTIGIFLRRLQSALQRGYDKVLDNVTHIVVDEVHERDIDTDLLLVVLKRLMQDRKAKGNPLKVVLMSATIDPTLFETYFADANGNPAKVVEIPGRSFPVQKHFLDNYLPSLVKDHQKSSWIFKDEKVIKYLLRELPNSSHLLPDSKALRTVLQRAASREIDDDLEIPYPVVALLISHVLQNSESGHVLVFLPGWDEIQAVQKILTDSSLALSLNFNDKSKYSLHVLHSTIPLAEQQVIFDPPPEGVRRIILSTNIAETSVTIPDVVYVVDTAKIKESRYDPERHISSLVSAWVGKSNLNQRAGRAGRHRPGEYYGVLGQRRADGLHTHQTVEMKRMDLSNVVMHVKALDFPGMDVEDVLAATVEPPAAERVAAAMKSLTMVGALDEQKNLTSLGRVLVQLPVEVQMGRLVLYGSFFKCLDQALTLAAIFTNRDPFLCPPLAKKEAQAVKDSWSPEAFRSDALAILSAYNAWYEFERKGDYAGGTKFCSENFLSKSTLLLIAKIKGHLLESLYSTGVIGVSGGGSLSSTRAARIPPELNENGNSLPLLAALIVIASQPKFAIRVSPMTYRTAQDKSTAIHPSSVNHRKRVVEDESAGKEKAEKQLFAFTEKRQNLSVIGQAPGQVYLVGCTRLDPMTYMLFGAYNLVATDVGLECDDWLPMKGSYDALDDVRRLKLLMEGCMLRVFEGIHHKNRAPPTSTSTGKYVPPNLRQVRDNDEGESDEEDDEMAKGGRLSAAEIKELDAFTHGIVRILDGYADERRRDQSRMNSRPATPILTPSMVARSLPGTGWRSGTATPLRYESRPGTPSRLSARGFS